MSSLPTIRCNSYSFTPIGVLSTTSYNIGFPMEENDCLVSAFKNKVLQGTPQTVDPRGRFPIDRELKILHNTEAKYVLCLLGSVLSACAAALFFQVKKNYKFSAVSAVGTGVLAISSFYFNRQCRKASFDAASKVLGTFLNETKPPYKYHEYHPF